MAVRKWIMLGLVTTTYGHWIRGEQPFIVSVRFTLKELDARLKAQLRMR